jgi:hypothetical protein
MENVLVGLFIARVRVIIVKVVMFHWSWLFSFDNWSTELLIKTWYRSLSMICTFSPLILQQWHSLSSNYRDMNIILLFSIMTLYWRHWRHLTKSSINLLSLKCFARNGLRCEIVLRNPFSQNKSMIVYIYLHAPIHWNT